MMYKSDVLIFTKEPNTNGRVYDLKETSFPSEVPLYCDEPTGNVKIDRQIGTTKLYLDGDKIVGKSHIYDEHTMFLLKTGLKLYTVTSGAGKLNEKTKVVEDYELQNVFITPNPADEKLTPLSSDDL